MDNTNDGQRTREGGVGRGRKPVPFEDTRPCARPATIDRLTKTRRAKERLTG
jgi:hypothetical protein